MAGVFQLRPEHVAALEDAGVGGCAECQRLTAGAHRRPAAVAPGTYVLRFHEFVNYAAVRDVWGAGAALVPARWRNVEGTSTVYIFRRLGGRTTLWQALAGGGTYTLVVRPEEAGATYYACLSRFALPPERIRQYTAPNALGLLGVRCVVLDLGDRQVARAAGGRTYDVVLCDYRRIVTELQARENDVFSAYDQFALSPDRVRRRYLANAALSVARDFAQAEPAAWGWIKPAGGRPARRLPGFESAPYTQPEAELLREERDLVQHRTAVEQWGSSKYAWMRQPAYREMCYDALRSPEDGKATVLAEGALLDRATESTAGRTFLTEYAVGNGSWYTRYVLHPLPYETE